jgi:hypothetical protein
MTDAHGHVLDLIFGRWRSQILYAGVKLGVFDALAAGRQAASQIAEQLELDPALSYRLLRALASLGLLREGKDRVFSLTSSGDLLRKDHRQTLRGVTLLEEGPEHYALWKHLPAMVREGEQNAFVREFGRMAFEHAAHDAQYAGVFNEAMSSYSSGQTAWVLEAFEGYDFSSIRHVCDVGGGHGHTLCALLAKHPHLRGTVLDLPSVVEKKELLWACKLGLMERCSYVGGDMFEAVPAADAYFMKMIVHDWNDDECVRVLQNISTAAAPGARLFVIEHIIPEPETSHFSKLFDIHMMCWGTGRERTREEYVDLLERAGWRYVTTRYPASRMMGAIEAVKPAS